MLEQLATTLLLALSALLGVEGLPRSTENWHVQGNGWQEIDGGRTLVTTSTFIVDECRAHQDAYVRFPMVVHGAHLLQLDGSTIAQFGSMDFDSARSFYGSPSLNCSRIVSGHELLWKVRSKSNYFARIPHFPEVSISRPLDNFFNETLVAVAAGSLIVMALITTLLFIGKVPRALALSVASTNFVLSGYFMAAVSEFYDLGFSMLTLHKVADTCMWLGSCLLLNAFRLQGLFSLKFLQAHCVLMCLGLAVLLNGESADVVQFGTMIPFTTFFAIMAVSLARLFGQIRDTKRKRHAWLQLLSLSSFVVFSLNDFFVVSGAYEGPILMSIGILGGTFFLTLDVNERIVDTYRERDYLRENLEHEVAMALSKIQSTQAELIQSAKMASLGTLSAGIAHEINNSLNYVNGALAPLEGLLRKAEGAPGIEKAQKLLEVMKSGLEVTFGIIKSLRTFSGLNQASLKDTHLLDLAQTVLTIVKNKIPENVQVQVAIPASLEARINGAGISQVLMNLIVNAVDALADGGEIQITGVDRDRQIEVTVADNGTGIAAPVLARIFEPFYTTKDVGKGTGLGLHICKTEIERHGGTLSVSSQLGKGTVFTLLLPKSPDVSATVRANGKEKAA